MDKMNDQNLPSAKSLDYDKEYNHLKTQQLDG
jgi:hypothetical protein